MKFCHQKRQLYTLFMANRVVNTREEFIGPTSGLAASLAKFDFFMSFEGFSLPHAIIPINM